MERIQLESTMTIGDRITITLHLIIGQRALIPGFGILGRSLY